MSLNGHVLNFEPDQPGIPYAVWKAEQLNQLFKQHGVLSERARILPATVLHGLTKTARILVFQ